MKITAHSQFLRNMQINRATHNNIGIPASKRDSVTIKASYDSQQAKAVLGKVIYSSSSDHFTSISGLESEISRLEQLLKDDSGFMNSNDRDYLNNKVGRELASNLIMSDRDMQEEIAKKMWESTAQGNAMKASNPGLYGEPEYLPKSYKDYDINAMLESGDEHTVDQVLMHYGGVLTKQARVSGLSDTERLLSSRIEKTELTAQGTFNQRIESILNQIDQLFEEKGLILDDNKTYSFHLNSDTFCFTVTGGTEQENTLIEQIVNSTHYDNDNLTSIISALSGHRQEDGKYNPWVVGNLPYKDEVVPEHGVADLPKDFVDKMESLIPAYERSNLNYLLNKQYGFGIDDIELAGNNKIVGKTEEISNIISAAGYDFMVKVGYSYISLMKNYKGTPDFSSPLFTLNGGKFGVNYPAE